MAQNETAEQLLREVLQEVRELREIVETNRADEEELEDLSHYEHPEQIITSFEEAKKLHGEPLN